MKKILLISVLTLAGCATITAVQTGKPIDPAQVQKDLVIARQAFQIGGCDLAMLGAAAAPIVAVAADAQGNKTLTAISATGAGICAVPAPPAIVSTPGTVLGIATAPAAP